jgi:hypothetical protein
MQEKETNLLQLLRENGKNNYFASKIIKRMNTYLCLALPSYFQTEPLSLSK